MSTYTCKCGKAFEKSTTAATTGNRMPDYGPAHECFGCPYVQETWVRNFLPGETDTKMTECRGCSKAICYTTGATTRDSKGSTLRIETLDLAFVDRLRDYCEGVPGISEHALEWHGVDSADGRWPYSLYFDANMKGEAAKEELLRTFFLPTNIGYTKTYARNDITPEEERELILSQIQKAIEEAQKVDINNEALAAEPKISESDAPEPAQEVPDDYAAEELPSIDSGSTEEPPCKWENASGGDDEPRVDDEEPQNTAPEITGERLSLYDEAFEEILMTADNVLNQLIRTLRDKRQHDGEMSIKITFEDCGMRFLFGGQVSGKINYALKPQKIVMNEGVEISFDAYGNPLIPYDRERQMTFDDQPVTGVITTVDGGTGLVESVDTGAADTAKSTPEEPCETSEAPQDEPMKTSMEDSAEASHCTQTECWFYADGNCRFDSDAKEYGVPAADFTDVKYAVEDYDCTNPDVIAEYKKMKGDSTDE